MSDLKLNAEPRVLSGRKVNQLRRRGLVPVVAYGALSAPLSLQVEERALHHTLQGGGASQVVALSVSGGGLHNVLIKNVQRAPVNHSLLHADLYVVNMNEAQHVAVALETTGKPVGMAAGLMIFQAHESIQIEALPADIPAEIRVDLSPLTLETPIHVRDLPAIQGVTYRNDPDELLFSLIVTRGAEAEVAETAAVVEPEVVTRGKQTAEE